MRRASGAAPTVKSFERILTYSSCHPDDAPTEKAIRELVDTYKTQFQQETVVRIRSHTCASF